MEPVKVRYLDGTVFSSDSGGNLIGVRVYRNGTAESISGSCTGYCILADGASIPVIGTVSGNAAYIVIPAAAYTVPGPINIILKIVDNTNVTTIAAVVSYVYGAGGTVTDPGQSTIDAWSAQITATLSALEASAVLYSQTQSLTTAQKQQARENIGAAASAVLISGDEYRIYIP
jgi:hypothetical protein